MESQSIHGHEKDTRLSGCGRLHCRNAFSTDTSWKIAVLPSARSQRELLTNDGAIQEIQERRLCHDNCTCTLLVFLVFIETLYNTVLNATSYETMYDSIALQTNKQTNNDNDDDDNNNNLFIAYNCLS